MDFFASRGHRVVPSSSLVPANDPTLLFSNAGMNQFKDVFLGRERRDYSRATTSQKCVRAGGKHNDLEQVGRTTRHHTFFEMLGNFSFGDYFKKEAIPWAWELITKEFAIPSDKLYVTVFREDDEAEEIWARDVGVPRDRIFRLDEHDNFWQMGDTGPCGPCSEIHYDLGPAASDQGHTDCKFPCDCGRYVELWNLVFMQFNRDEQGVMTPLPRPSIDTGAGLERLASVLQGKLSNFETDLFRPLIEEAAALANVEYGANHDADVSLRIIADHARSATFLISDGVLPSNEGRGYVLRLIMRRALYHGQTLGLNEPFLYKISSRVVDMMKDAYPELVQTAPHVAKAIKKEEEQYARTVKEGLGQLEETDLRKDEFVRETLDALPVTQNVGQSNEFTFREWKKRHSQGFFNPTLGCHAFRPTAWSCSGLGPFQASRYLRPSPGFRPRCRSELRSRRGHGRLRSRNAEAARAGPGLVERGGEESRLAGVFEAGGGWQDGLRWLHSNDIDRLQDRGAGRKRRTRKRGAARCKG